MSTQNGLKIGSGLAAVVLLGTLTMPAGFAAEANTAGPGDSHAANPATKPDHAPPTEEKAAPETGARNPEKIDTRISVQPHRAGGKLGKTGEVKTKFNLSLGKNPHRRTFSASGATHPVVRNAIGAPITPHEGSERREIEHVGAAGIPHTPGTATPGGATNPALVLVKPATALPRPAVAPGNVTSIVVPTGRGIAGTSLSHRSAAPGIGGPAKTAAGINGTTIRPLR